jgi:hypothetical protein
MDPHPSSRPRTKDLGPLSLSTTDSQVNQHRPEMNERDAPRGCAYVNPSSATYAAMGCPRGFKVVLLLGCRPDAQLFFIVGTSLPTMPLAPCFSELTRGRCANASGSTRAVRISAERMVRCAGSRGVPSPNKINLLRTL